MSVAWPRKLQRMCEHARAVAHDAPRHSQTAGRRVDHRGARGLHRGSVVAVGFVDRTGNGGGRRLRRISRFEVDEREREAQPTHAVGDRVVDLLQECAASAGEPFDERELPQRAGPVERLLGERPAQVEEGAVGVASGKRDAPHVGIEVERRIVGERGRHDAQWRAHDALAQAGIAATARASVWSMRSSSGTCSRIVRLQKSERSAGSFSTAHMIASVSDMRTGGNVPRLWATRTQSVERPAAGGREAVRPVHLSNTISRVEVYTPIPTGAIRHTPRPARIVGTLFLVVALLFVSVRLVRYTFQLGAPPDFHYYGTVETRFGTAGVFCGGDAAPACGDGTALELPTCTQAVRAYFTNDTGMPQVAGGFDYVDAQARALLGKRPPSGDTWAFGCGNGVMIRGGPANLQPL